MYNLKKKIEIGGGIMRAAATVLSNNILLRAKKENIPVTPMKLQKLLYYVCVCYVQKTNKLPISEHFEVWKYGPVIASVYNEFKSFGSNPIKKLAKDANGKAQIVDEQYCPRLKHCIDYVWTKYKSYTGIELSQRTHWSGSGWYSAFQRGSDAISTEEMINDRTI